MNLRSKIDFLTANPLCILVKVKYSSLIPNHGHMVVFYTSGHYHLVSVDHLIGSYFFLTDNLKNLQNTRDWKQWGRILNTKISGVTLIRKTCNTG